MPTVLRKNGFQVRIYSNDHDPAHVHVFKSDGEAKIQIKNQNGDPEWISVDRMSDKDALKALEIVIEHQSDLLEKWWKYHGSFESR